MATLELTADVTERALDVLRKTLPANEADAFLDALLHHQVIDYVTWRRFRFAGWTMEDVLREVRKVTRESA